MAIYCDDRFAFVENLHDYFNAQQEMKEVKIDVFVVVLCLRGKASLCINGDMYEMQTNDLLVCLPNIILERSMASMDIEFRCISLSRDYVRQLPILKGGNLWDMVLAIEQNPVLSLTAEEAHLFCQYYDFIRGKLTSAPHRYQEELTDALLHAFIYDFSAVLDRFATVEPQTLTSGKMVFRKFFDLLTSMYPKPRSVSYYADRLCLTPKYLSNVCKEACGHTATELINECVAKDIRLLLKKPEKNIKDICNELDFPNLSFFGRYVKRHLGMSPKRWREENQL